MKDPRIDILLVEDDAGDAGLVKRALQKNNLAENLVHVKDGQEALDLLLGTNVNMLPKVVLLDLKLPKVDGLEVLRRLRSNPATRLLPVVMLTSSNQCSDIDKCYQLGGNSYIVKPLELDNFTKTVTELANYWLLRNTVHCS